MTQAGGFDTDFGVMEDFARWGRLGNALRVFLSQSSVRLGDRVRLRLINAAIDRVFPLDLNGINGAVVALDGMPLSQPIALEQLKMAPGQRVDVIGTVISDVSISTSDGDSLRQIGRISMNGTNPTPGPELVQPLPGHGLPTPVSPGQSLKLVMRGGEGDPDHGGFGTWSFNGVSGLPMEPLGQFRRGTLLRSHCRTQPHSIMVSICMGIIFARHWDRAHLVLGATHCWLKQVKIERSPAFSIIQAGGFCTVTCSATVRTAWRAGLRYYDCGNCFEQSR